MGRPSRETIQSIHNLLSFEAHNKQKKFFLLQELKLLYKDNEDSFCSYSSHNSWRNSAINHNILKSIYLDFPNQTYTRFFLNDPTSYEIAMSINEKVYLSHYTAIFLHGLTLNIPKIIYANLEQTPKKRVQQELHQINIDKAFHRHPRVSKNIDSKFNICLLNGKHTKELGVEEKKLSKDITVRLTNIERSLIDITVSPYYCGGVNEVLKVYKNAKNQISPKKMVTILKKLDYMYPIHQTVGFYLEKIGCKESDLRLFEDMGINFKFYTSRNISNRQFNKRWSLYYPEFL